jgi:hypothetical protein
MGMLFAYLFSIQMQIIAALLAAGMVILGGARFAAARTSIPSHLQNAFVVRRLFSNILPNINN